MKGIADMRNRLIRTFTKSKKGTLGYTLTEMLTVIGIIVVLLSIAIPSVISLSKSMKFAQRNDYAKSIFMAAQANLTEMRADGGLGPLQAQNANSMPVREELCNFPVEDWSPEYVYTASGLSVGQGQRDTYALVLPEGSVDGSLRSQQVIIEYNPLTGNIYAVFYSEDELITIDGKEDTLLGHYQESRLPRNGESDVKKRKDIMVGYYDGSGLSSAELEIERTKAWITFDNGEEGIVTVHIPMPELYVGAHDEFMKGLEVKLDIKGEMSKGEVKNILVKQPGTVGNNCKLDVDGKTVMVTYVLDSLADRMSFANLSYGTRQEPGASQGMNTGNNSLTNIMSESEFAGKILPGENVELLARVTFHAAEDRPSVVIQDSNLGNVNPMFGHLVENLDEEGTYALTIDNGRNLQNLNAIAPTVAKKITSVLFTSDIYWNHTVAYYNQNYPRAGGYQNNADEAPARALPYFVPIHNQDLFGTAQFVYLDGADREDLNLLQQLLELFSAIDFQRNERVPTLSDELDTVKVNPNDEDSPTIADTHAQIDGGGHAVYYLNINSNLYAVPNAGDANKEGKFYATGDRQIINYHFTGLFGYVNTPIFNLHVVNPIIKGHDFDDVKKTVIKNVETGKDWLGRPQYGDREVNATVYSDPATGALVGACGYNTYLYNCSVYMDTKAGGFNWNYADHGTHVAQDDFTAAGDQDWYGVSGAGAVGGLVGYAKSHRTTTGALTDNKAVLAFNRCFAAVPVSGKLRGNGEEADHDNGLYGGGAGMDKDYGYSNGVGGLVGNSQLTNFYNCYASGNVRVTNTYSQSFGEVKDTLQTVLGLGGNGRLSMGGGGFVGTSHGTRYTNCFASGNVTRVSGNGTMANAGGFVGMMCYDETRAYGHHKDNSSAYGSGENKVDQNTVFQSCYAVGMCVDGNGNYLESFAGGTGTISVNYGSLKAYYSPDYYRLLAPYFIMNAADPEYQTHYVFKDSYYLSQYRGNDNVSQEQSKKCANPIGYSDLVNLHVKYGNAEWIQGNISQMKTYPLDAQVAEVALDLADEMIRDFLGNWNLGQAYQRYKDLRSIVQKNHPNYWYQMYFDLFDFLVEEGMRAKTPTLDDIYFAHYTDGFPSKPWETPVERNTHYYGEATAGMVYPFPKLDGLDYYGIWPAEPLTGGLAYYERYENTDGTTTYGYYFDRADTSSLRSTEETAVLHDGYAIFSGTKDDIIVIYNADGQAISGGLRPAQNSITLSSPFSPDNSSYYVTRIPDSVLNNLTPGGDGFYSAIMIQVSNESGTGYYWALFNPNTGISQINRVTFGTDGKVAYPENPENVLIRTARQLNALSEDRMQGLWASEGTTITQQLHIDASIYDWNNDGVSNGDDQIPVLESIGTEEHPFNAAYTGNGGYVAQAKIEGFQFESPIFGYVSSQGSIRGLNIQVENDLEILDADEDGFTALVAAVCAGDMENVDMTITGDVTLTAETAAGLLAGYVCGTEENPADITGCDITVENMTITAENAGAVIGQAEYCNVAVGLDSESVADDMSLTIEGTLTLNATEAGGFLGMSGDLDQDKTPGDVNVDGLAIEIHTINSTAARTGALVGTLEKGSIRNLTMNLDGSYTASNDDESTVIAGVAAVAKNATVQNVTVTIPGTISGDTAAGVFGTALALNVQTTEVTVTGTISGTEAAAGMAYAVDGGTFTAAAVKLKGTITANGSQEVTTEDTTDEQGNVIPGTTTVQPIGRAAGFAVEVKGQVDSALVIGETAGSVIGSKEASLFACEVTSNVTGSRVAGFLTAEGGESAAGFAVKIAGDLTINANGVTPALENTTVGYLDCSNDYLTVKGGTAALFAVEIGKGATVTNCYALGTVEGDVVSGFADTNNGSIDGCSANVTISGGYAFVRSNIGAVSNSYGWYGDDNFDPDVPVEENATMAVLEGNVLGSYFVDLDVPAIYLEELDTMTNGDKYRSAVIYDSAKGMRRTTPLDPDFTAKLLNGQNSSRWFNAGTYGSYPFSKLVPISYPFPMLRVHYGDWATPPRYAFGVLYYEKNVLVLEDDSKVETWKLQVVDMSDPDMTVEKKSLSGYYTITNQGRVFSDANIFNNDDSIGDIVEVGYAAFYKDTLEDMNLLDHQWGDHLTLRISDKTVYTIRKMTASYGHGQIVAQEILAYPEVDENGNTTSIGKTVTMGTNYAHEFNLPANQPHIIRTEGQLKKAQNVGSYKQTHDIILAEDFVTITGFAGTYDGNGMYIQKPRATNGWMNGVSGSIQNLELVLGDLNTSFFGDVSGTISLNGLSIDAVGASGSLINNMNGTLNCDLIEVGGELAGTVIGTANVNMDMAVRPGSIAAGGSLVRTVSANVQVGLELNYGEAQDIAGHLVNNVNGAVTLTNDPNFGTAGGSLFETVAESGSVTLSQGITVDTLSGSLVGTNNGTVNTGAVHVGTLSGALVNTMTKGNVTTGIVTVDDLDASLVAAFNGGVLTGTQVNVTNGITVPVFTGTLANGAEIRDFMVTGDVTLDGQAAQGALVNTNNGTLKSLTLKADAVTVEAEDNAVIGTLVGINTNQLTDCQLMATDDETVTAITITGNKAKSLTFGGLVGENSGEIKGTTEVEADITYIQPIGKDSADAATIGGLVGKMSGGTLENAYVTGSIDLTNIEQIEAAAAIAEAEEQGIELVDEPNPTPVDSNRSYIIGGAVGNLLAGSASETEANVALVPAWKGASQVANANTFGTSGITNQGPVGMFVGFAGAVTIENCASIETTNETFQFLGEAMIGELNYQDGTWVSTVKADSILSYTDSAYCNGNVYTSADSADITVIGKSAADKYNGIVTNLTGEEGCTFYLNGVQNFQSYGYDANTYSKANTAQNGYKITQVTGTLNSVGTPRVKDVKDADKTSGFVDSPYYIRIGGQYYRLGVKVESRWIFVTVRDYYFAWYTDNGTYEQIGYVTGTTPGYTRSLNDNDVKWTHKPEAYYTLTTPSSLDTSKQYLVVGPQGPYASTGNAGDGIVTVPFASSFRQRDEMYNAIWTLSTNGNAHTWTTVAHGLVFNEPNPGLSIPGKFTSPVVKYTINGAVCDLYIVEIDPALAYEKVVFTYAPATLDIREYIICKPVTAAANVTESDLPGESGEAPTAQEGNNN